MKLKLRILIGLMVPLLAGALLFGGCKTAERLEPGGAYTAATTNTAGEVTIVPDAKLFVADQLFALAYGTLDSAFRIERENRAALWAISPKIKDHMDTLRKEAVRYKRLWAEARQAYQAAPTEGKLAELLRVLAALQKVAALAPKALDLESK